MWVHTADLQNLFQVVPIQDVVVIDHDNYLPGCLPKSPGSREGHAQLPLADYGRVRVPGKVEPASQRNVRSVIHHQKLPAARAHRLAAQSVENAPERILARIVCGNKD
jgi:hypothetical protein